RMSQHLHEQDLVLYYYGEDPETQAEAAQHLLGCPECRAQLGALKRVHLVVELPVPERSVEFEDRVWQTLQPKLGIRQRWTWFRPRQWSAAALTCALVVIAYVAGRYTPVDRAGTETAEQVAPVRERVLIIAVGDHLERSKMVLAELVNQDGTGTVDISNEQRSAELLLRQNRLFRQTASAAGDDSLATLLEDLERVLAEVAHSSSEVSVDQLDEIRQRIEGQGLIFKMRVVESTLKTRAKEPMDSPAGKQL
ncbi:MAG TPA: hypothetical protein VEQ63_01055, partial [Bryobacteraceae bacterium]|nr:hypothetical protein [Bryobacteraceae bacterium]